ncbi:MAG: hypothetical protein FWG82_06720 [Oscillospiraceae bacterium]|nr:hypothetical protein [Oscillospiraceae bacterium]
MAEKKKSEFLLYKGKPFVRSGNQLYYGNMSDPYVVFMQVLNNRNVSGREIADKVVVQLVTTDADASTEEQIVQNTIRRGLYDAMDVGRTWLARENVI